MLTLDQLRKDPIHFRPFAWAPRAEDSSTAFEARPAQSHEQERTPQASWLAPAGRVAVAGLSGALPRKAEGVGRWSQ